MNTNSWYALFTVTGEEEKVKERLQFRFKDRFQTLIPRRRLRERKNGVWTETMKVLFPGYVLIHGPVKEEDPASFKDIPGLLKLIRTGKDLAQIDPGEMDILLKLAGNNGTIGFSKVLVENGRVIVTDGPLTALEGIIASIDTRKGRAKVVLNFMGNSKTVDLGIDLLQPAGES